MLNLLFIADVIGAPGREVVQALLPGLRKRLGVGLVVCNGENAAGGFGLTQDSARALLGAGVDVLTGGNHLWDRKESLRVPRLRAAAGPAREHAGRHARPGLGGVPRRRRHSGRDRQPARARVP